MSWKEAWLLDGEAGTGSRCLEGRMKEETLGRTSRHLHWTKPSWNNSSHACCDAPLTQDCVAFCWFTETFFQFPRGCCWDHFKCPRGPSTQNSRCQRRRPAGVSSQTRVPWGLPCPDTGSAHLSPSPASLVLSHSGAQSQEHFQSFFPQGLKSWVVQ